MLNSFEKFWLALIQPLPSLVAFSGPSTYSPHIRGTEVKSYPGRSSGHDDLCPLRWIWFGAVSLEPLDQLLLSLSLVLAGESSWLRDDVASAESSLCRERASVTSSEAMSLVSGSALSLMGWAACLIWTMQSQPNECSKDSQQNLKQQGCEKAKATSSTKRGDLPPDTTLFIGVVKHVYYGALNGPIHFP
jgi:hypothetical protein